MIIAEIIPNIIAFLSLRPEMSIVWGRYIVPDFSDSDNHSVEMPKIAISQEWWDKWWRVKIMFTVRSDTIKETRLLAFSIIDALCEEYDTPDVFKRIELSSGIFDRLSTVWWYPESVFYLDCYTCDS